MKFQNYPVGLERVGKALALAVLVVGFTFNMAHPALALVWNETTDGGGDAGSTFATAQVVGPGVNQITGSLPDLDKDYFKITLPAGNFDAFNLTNNGPGGSISSIALFDFGENQLAICNANNNCFDTYNGTGDSFLIAGGLAPGMYYIVLDDIASSITTGDYSFEFSPATVPIPAALPLFLSGLALVGLVARRQNKQDSRATA